MLVRQKDLLMRDMLERREARLQHMRDGLADERYERPGYSI